MKTFLAVILTAFITVAGYSVDYNQYREEIVARFEVGEKVGELGYDYSFFDPIFSPGVFGMGTDDEGSLYLCDFDNKRLVILDEKMDISISHKPVLASLIHIEGSRYWGQTGPYMVSGYDFENNETFTIDTRELTRWDVDSSRRYLWIKNILFFTTTDGRLWGILDPGSKEYHVKEDILNADSLRRIIAEDPRGVYDGLVLDDKDRIFVDAGLVTGRFDVFFEYWEEQHKEQGGFPSLENVHLDDTYWYKRHDSVDYMGRDTDGNIYWNTGSRILIYDRYGWLFDALELKDGLYKVPPVVSRKGDIYVLYFKDGVYELKRTARVW